MNVALILCTFVETEHLALQLRLFGFGFAQTLDDDLRFIALAIEPAVLLCPDSLYHCSLTPCLSSRFTHK